MEKSVSFQTCNFKLPAGLIVEAIEVKKDILQGYHFNMLFDFYTDPEFS